MQHRQEYWRSFFTHKNLTSCLFCWRKWWTSAPQGHPSSPPGPQQQLTLCISPVITSSALPVKDLLQLLTVFQLVLVFGVGVFQLCFSLVPRLFFFFFFIRKADTIHKLWADFCHYFWYSFDFPTIVQQLIGQLSSENHISQQNFNLFHVAFTSSNLDSVHSFLVFFISYST